MRSYLAALASVFIATQAAAGPHDGVLAAAQRFDDAFNTGDKAAVIGACTADAIIIDDFAPHVWQGANACGVWWDAYAADATANGIAGGIVAIGKPFKATVAGDRGYVVFPAKYTYTQHGKPVAENGSNWTMALQKIGGVWKISGWAWAQH